MPGFRLTSETVNAIAAIRMMELDAIVALQLIMQQVGTGVVEYLQSLTSEMRPGIKGGPMRRAHPGHWADVTGDLARSYSFEVLSDGRSFVSLDLRNNSDHAAYLEARDGYFVLSGVADPGGPVEQAIRNVVERIAPDWEVR